MNTLIFEYINAENEFGRYELVNWKEEGFYLIGMCSDKQIRTFRKDRVHQYLTHEEALNKPYTPPPPKIKKNVPPDNRLQILFTGFAKALRIELEEQAEFAGLRVMKTRAVGTNLDFLVFGKTAGPKKISKAMQQETYIVSEKQFYVLAETGELIDEIVD